MSEFSRPLRIEDLGRAPVHREIAASPSEREALARRFDLVSLEAMTAELTAERIADGIALNGSVHAEGAQSCVISGLPVPFRIGEPMTLRFERGASSAADELELSDADLDVLPLEGDTIDIGEAAAQALGLALDPYPKANDAALADYRRHLVSEEDAARQASPFAVLRPGTDR